MKTWKVCGKLGYSVGPNNFKSKGIFPKAVVHIPRKKSDITNILE